MSDWQDRWERAERRDEDTEGATEAGTEEAPASERESEGERSEKPEEASSTERGLLPPWKVILHNDHYNDMMYVVEMVMALTSLNEDRATRKMLEAHRSGRALLLTTHRERAELYVQQFGRRNLTVTVEAG